MRALALAALGLLAGCRASTEPRTPNLLLITLDTTRADHLGCYGQPRALTPALDALAADGALFLNAYVQASSTPVSHASILTGLNPYAHGLRVLHGLHDNRLPETAVSLAEVLSTHGYATAAFISAFPAGESFGLAQGFGVFDAEFMVDDEQGVVSAEGVVNTGRNQRRAADTSDRALAWLDGRRGPWLAWLHYFDPHDPELLPPDDWTRNRQLPRDDPEAFIKALYQLEVEYMDEHVGRVLDGLRKSGQLADTAVLVISDHGQGLGDHDWWTHGILYQEQIHAPLILRLPDSLRPTGGSRHEFLVRSIDVMPTLLELADVEPAAWPPMQGVSLLPALLGAPPPRLSAYADSLSTQPYMLAPVFGLDSKQDQLFALVDWPWKLILHLPDEAASELYDLAADPRELENLYARRPEVVARLREQLETHAYRWEPGAGSGQQLSPEDVERLRSLGYLQ